MANTTQLKQTDGAIQVKAGDFGSRFAFQLLDEHGNLMEELNGQTASVKLTLGEDVIHELDVLVENGEVAFKFNEVLPAGKYWVEIWVANYIFPSDRKTKLKIIKAAKDREVLPTPPKTLALPPVRDLAGNPVDKVVLHDVHSDIINYPRTFYVVLDQSNNLPEYWANHFCSVTKIDSSGQSLLIFAADKGGNRENESVIEFEVGGVSHTIELELIRHSSPTPPKLTEAEIILNQSNNFRQEIDVSHLPAGSSTHFVADKSMEGVNAYLTTPTTLLFYLSNPQESQAGQCVIDVYHEHYVDAVSFNVRVEM